MSWYPGKLVGFRKRLSQSSEIATEKVDSSEVVNEDKRVEWKTIDETELSASGDSKANRESSYFTSWLRRGAVDANVEDHEDVNRNSPMEWDRPSESTGDVRSDDGGEETKKESSIAKTVRKIRNKFIDRRLIGKIFIYRICGVISTAVTCEIGLKDKLSIDDDDLSDLSFTERRALSMTDTILNSLERRSKAWDGVDFNSEVMLTRGATLGFSDPFLGMIGWSITVDISATVPSLLASRRRFEENQITRGSFSSMINFKPMNAAPTRSLGSVDNSETGKLNTTGTIAKISPVSQGHVEC